jgi:hypothetical protein
LEARRRKDNTKLELDDNPGAIGSDVADSLIYVDSLLDTRTETAESQFRTVSLLRFASSNSNLAARKTGPKFP